ncbi:hypothetical protein GPROT2_00689 [Gammaproteobacteria bacterium]|nr:PIG-L family deacetylase [Gammaproteobacteria bacterium]QOJ32485.1 MAG: PIG-L family deacetylase [Gammaproteobacteria bacterium]CAG0939685.1 hypothetical protein GPROT2_00689 [Gammaproteobacteria bacterium]
MSGGGAMTVADAAYPGPGGPGRPAFGPLSRLLVVAPHPDDETIAAAGLMQAARQAGATVRVWLLTDGDNNPWPQRWVERRWRIDDGARRRWGRRRRAESMEALQRMGFDPAAVLQPFGWPDGGLTDRFIADPGGLMILLQRELSAFSPTDLVIPAVTDRHPDHGTAGLLMTLAARQAGLAQRVLSYRIHGGRPAEAALAWELDDSQWASKQRAMTAYATQSALSASRLRRMAGRREVFRSDPFWPWPGRVPVTRLEPGPGGGSLVFDLGWPARVLARQRLLVVAAPPGGTPTVRVIAGPALAALARRQAGGIRLTVQGLATENCHTFLKLEPLRRGPWIFDRCPWLGLPAQGAPTTDTRDPIP